MSDTQDVEALVARLESLADCDTRAGEPLGKCMREAATALRTENARASSLEAQLAGAKEALEPFADQSKRFEEGAVRMGFAPSFDEYRPAVSFTHGELRAARRAYDALPAALTPLGEE